MSRVRLIHWNGPEGREGALRLASLGFHPEFDDVDGPRVMRLVRANPPDACVIDLSRLPSHGREVGLALRSSTATRRVPLVFVDGDPEKIAKIKSILPDATYTTWGRLKRALPRAIAKPPRDPVVPPSSIFSNKPAVEKLGIKQGMRVALLGAPPGFGSALKPLPSKVKFSARPEPSADLFLCVVRNLRELNAQLAALARTVERQTLWMIWPKEAGRAGRAGGAGQTDINGNVVRQTGLASGWVDYKICSVDETWSGLAFKKRAGRAGGAGRSGRPG